MSASQVRIPRTASQWEIFSSMPRAGEVAEKLFNLVYSASAEAVKMLPQGIETARKHCLDAYATLQKQYPDYGMEDAEPYYKFCHAVDAVMVSSYGVHLFKDW